MFASSFRNAIARLVHGRRRAPSLDDYEPLAPSSPARSPKTSPLMKAAARNKTPTVSPKIATSPSPKLAAVSSAVEVVAESIATLADPVVHPAPSATEPAVAAVRRVNATSATSSACVICFEDKLRDAQSSVCSCPICTDCVREYIKVRCEDAIGFVPPIHCPLPSCRRFIPFADWRLTVNADVASSYMLKAESLISLRCPSCDETNKLLTEPILDKVERAKNTKEFLAAWKKFGGNVTEMKKICAQYRDAQCKPRDVIEIVSKRASERGLTDGPASEWVHTRVEAMLALVTDPERRVTLKLALLRAFPTITLSECACGDEICFRCQSYAHDGTTCAQNEEVNLESFEDATFCPNCGVGIVRSEGCNSIVCICGEEMCYDCAKHIDACECY